MKQIGRKIFVIAFFIICLIPIGCMGFVSSDLEENRSLSEWPVWTSEDGNWNQNFFNEVQTYVAEHFAFRSQLVELDSRLKYTLLHSPSDEQVVLGKDGWLFFDATLDDFAGVTLTAEEIGQIADKLSRVCDYIEEQGKEPLLLLVPNKNSVYPEYMPSRFGSGAQITNLTLLQEAFVEKGVPYVDARKTLIDGKELDELYLHKDTHWNDTGARLVMNQIFAAWGMEDSFTLDGYTVEAVHEPDLYNMLFPTDDYLEEQHVYPDKEADFSYVGRVRSMDDLTIKTTSEKGNGKSVLVYRDSFGRAMIPYMGNIFDNCTFNRSTPYDLSLVEEVDCDYVLIEIVERNIPDLGDIEVE